MTEALKIGLLGHGTVGGAFDELITERGDAIENATGKRAEISGVLTTSIGDFDEILAGADVIVELMGGTGAAREHVLAALEAGKPVITANKQLLAQHGAELFEAAELGEQLLVGGDDRFAGFERREHVLARRSGAAHQLDDHVRPGEDLVEVTGAGGQDPADLGPLSGCVPDRRRAIGDQLVEGAPDRAVTEQPDLQGVAHASLASRSW